jgi:hypothetical protein
MSHLVCGPWEVIETSYVTIWVRARARLLQRSIYGCILLVAIL